MERQEQLVHARAVLTVAATKRGKTIYLKIPNDINTFGIQHGDSVQIAYMGKLYPEPTRPDPEEEREAKEE